MIRGEPDKPKTKAQIVTALSEKTGLPKQDVIRVLKAQAELAQKEIGVGFTIPGVGKLTVVHRKARTGRKFATRESITIPATKGISFRAASKIAEVVIIRTKKKRGLGGGRPRKKGRA